jgi:AraC-like DNA-binding protein
MIGRKHPAEKTASRRNGTMIAASIGIELARTFGQRTGIAKRMSGKAWTSVKQQIAVFHKLDNGVSAVTRALTNSGQPLSSIAYASGYCDYTHFARVYRRRLVVSGHNSSGSGLIRESRRCVPILVYVRPALTTPQNHSPGFDPS